MLRTSLLALIVMVCCGFGSCRWLGLKEPFDAQCDAGCFEHCAKPIKLALPRQQTTAADEAQALVKRYAELSAEQGAINDQQGQLCDTKRGLCASCLERLKTAKVIQ